MQHSKWIKLLPNKTVYRLREMNWTYAKIDKLSRSIHLKVLIIILLGLITTAVSRNLFPLILIVFGIAYRIMEFNAIKNKYSSFTKQRNIEFLYFFMLLVPHLRQAQGKTGLYRVLSKMEDRLNGKGINGSDGILKDGINRLMLRLTNQPGSVEPFLLFAKECSGSELAEDVSVSLFDWQQNSDDEHQIERLKGRVDRALEKRIEEIVNAKIDRFYWYSSRVVSAVFIVFLGILISGLASEVLKVFSLIK